MGYEDFSKAVIPARNIFLIVPSDTATFTKATRGISFASAGALAVVTQDGDTVTIPNGALAAGIIHPLSVKQVLLTGTSATGIVGYR